MARWALRVSRRQLCFGETSDRQYGVPRRYSRFREFLRPWSLSAFKRLKSVLQACHFLKSLDSSIQLFQFLGGKKLAIAPKPSQISSGIDFPTTLRSRSSVVVKSCLVHCNAIGPVGRSLRIVIARQLFGCEGNRRNHNTLKKQRSKGRQ